MTMLLGGSGLVDSASPLIPYKLERLPAVVWVPLKTESRFYFLVELFRVLTASPGYCGGRRPILLFSCPAFQ